MPRTSSQPASGQLSVYIDAFVEAAQHFTPRDKGESTFRKWLAGVDPQVMSEDRQLAMMADAVLLTADLLLSNPSANGTTAFHRLARTSPGASAHEKTALEALCQARFRLLRLQGAGRGDDVAVSDVVTGQTLRIVDAELPPLPDGTMLFGRIAMLGEHTGCQAGSLTPLDEAAAAVANAHPARGAAGGSAATRWADAIYGRVVRHGTLDVPGLNRPREGIDFDAAGHVSEALDLVQTWADLDGAAPSPELLQRTRQAADLNSIMEVICTAEAARQTAFTPMASCCERVLLVQLETVLRRERSGSSGLTLDQIGGTIDDAVRARQLPKTAAKLFATLRAQLGGASAAPGKDGLALGRLMQVIQGLRAKTVDQGCTEQEALAAAEKVADLLDRYGLSLGEVDFRAQACGGAAVQTSRKRSAPVDRCLGAIAAYFDCRVWLERDEAGSIRYVFFGLHADVAAAQYLHDLVERAFITETDAFRAGALYAASAGERRTATNSFQIGLADGISRKLNKMQAARESQRRSSSGRDLVVVKASMVDEEVAKLGLNFHSVGRSAGKRVLSDAFSAGREAGERFEWAQAISEAA